jgi:hypothetical protein
MRTVPLAPKSIPTHLTYDSTSEWKSLFSDPVNFATVVKFNKNYRYLKLVIGFAHITWEDHMLETYDSVRSEKNTEC